MILLNENGEYIGNEIQKGANRILVIFERKAPFGFDSPNFTIPQRRDNLRTISKFFEQHVEYFNKCKTISAQLQPNNEILSKYHDNLLQNLKNFPYVLSSDIKDCDMKVKKFISSFDNDFEKVS